MSVARQIGASDVGVCGLLRKVVLSLTRTGGRPGNGLDEGNFGSSYKSYVNLGVPKEPVSIM